MDDMGDVLGVDGCDRSWSLLCVGVGGCGGDEG